MLKRPVASTSHSPPTLKPAFWTRSFTSLMLSDFPSAAFTRTSPVDRSADAPSTTSRSRIDVSTPRVHSAQVIRSEEHTSELQSHSDLVCRLLLEKKNTKQSQHQ